MACVRTKGLSCKTAVTGEERGKVLWRGLLVACLFSSSALVVLWASLPCVWLRACALVIAGNRLKLGTTTKKKAGDGGGVGELLLAWRAMSAEGDGPARGR